jgi:hypothetical protein
VSGRKGRCGGKSRRQAKNRGISVHPGNFGVLSDAEASVDRQMAAGRYDLKLGIWVMNSMGPLPVVRSLEVVVVGDVADCDLGEAAVLDLLDLVLGDLLLVVLQAKRAEAEEGDLEQAYEPQCLPQSARLDGGVVEAPHFLAIVPLIEKLEVVEVLHNCAGGGKAGQASKYGRT